MSSETRKIIVTGGPSVFRVDGGGEQAAKTRRKRSNGGATQPQAIVKVGGATSAPAQLIESETKAINIHQTPQEVPTQTAPALQSSRVVLGGKKPKHMKVVLTKKNHEETTATVPPAKSGRKVSLGLSHLKRRVTRARRLNKLSKTASIEQIKKELVAAHIIKEDSKAPEHILRQMYADAKLLTSKSL